jgi:adenosylcobinamide amidohydrolase
MNIELHIDRIILDGITLTAYERTLFQAALETELTTLLSAPGISITGDIAVPDLRGGDVTWNGNPTALGMQVAQVIYGGISDGKRD